MFIWSEQQKQSVTSNMSVWIETSPCYPTGRYDIIGKLNGFILIKLNGVGASVPWHRCNPESILGGNNV
jgi:hypothetical protein